MPNKYASYAEASAAAQRLGLHSRRAYRQGYQQDPKLSGAPEVVYSSDWQDWYHFLAKTKPEAFYATYAEASAATQRLGCMSIKVYKQACQQDPRLPSTPNFVYDRDWVSWPHFFGRNIPEAFYSTYAEASAAAQRLGFKGIKAYQQGYQQDPKLPSAPAEVYNTSWIDWYSFLGKNRPEAFYATYAEASAAAQRLRLVSAINYKQNYQQDRRLPSNPQVVYRTEWVNWHHFFGGTRPEVFYASYAEASAATQQLGLESITAYRKGHKRDPRLPASPDMVYDADWVDWSDFLGKNRPVVLYATYAEASAAAQQLGLDSVKAYRKGHKRDPRLTASPDVMYDKDWVDWFDFFGKDKPPAVYTTYAEASAAAQQLGLESIKFYSKGYKRDPRLPPCPNVVYDADWVDWYDFLRKNKPVAFYDTYAEASSAAQKLGLESIKRYRKGHKRDPRLPASPDVVYDADWVDWYDFFGKDKPVPIYASYPEASAATQRLGFETSKAYHKGYRQDPRLPANPKEVYVTDWVDWYHFLGKNRPEAFHATYAEASAAAQRLGLVGKVTYIQGYQQDPRLPSNPSIMYEEDWVDWYHFLGKDKPEEFYATYAEASAAAQQLGLDSRRAYRQGYEQDPMLPAAPEVVYNMDWQGYSHFFGNTQEIQSHPNLIDAIDMFVEEGTNQTAKRRNLLAFIRDVAVRQDLPDQPGMLLSKDIPFPERAYEAFVYATGETQQRSRHNICVNFFDWLLENYCSDEDDDGVLTPMLGFRNPLRTLLKGFLEQLPIARPSESNKPVLPMRSILKAKNHLIPFDAKTFSDLYLLHPFLEDCWTEINSSLVDENDPNCVTRKVIKDRKLSSDIRYRVEVTEIWSPVKLIANYCLFSMPLRGQQILWLDSGEGDEVLPVWQNGRVSWIKNQGPLTRPKRQKGFLQKGDNGENSSYITTNKTGRRDGGYRVPYMPDTLAYWVIKLREWQSKYNPLQELTPWTKIKLRQSTNKDVLKHRGQQAFLFRDPASVVCADKFSPMFTTTAFARTLPALLFHSQEPSEDLAIHQPTQRSFKYHSPFTPHSLRVSLITAYVVDGAAPLSVISKLVGHASLVMTIYYTKVGHGKMRQALNEAEKRAAEQNVDRIQDLIIQKRIDEAKPELIASDRSLMDQFISPEWPSSAFQIMSIGICPMGGGACDEGGDLLLERSSEKVFSPVPNGYLGARNCPRCRFFISGPAFLGGLSAISNEVILEINTSRKEYHELENQIQELEDQRFDLESAGLPFKKHYKLKQMTAAFEEKAKKLDVLATDFQHLYRYISQSTKLLNSNESGKKQLIVSDRYIEIEMLLEEQRTEFRLLAEVCSNAEIYSSSSCSRALPLLTQMLDRVVAVNGLSPSMFRLTEEQQLKAANQVVKLIMESVQYNWHTADQLINGQLMLEELGIKPEIAQIKKEIESIMHGSLNRLVSNEA